MLFNTFKCSLQKQVLDFIRSSLAINEYAMMVCCIDTIYNYSARTILNIYIIIPYLYSQVTYVNTLAVELNMAKHYYSVYSISV
jgi:hypothetical protein